MKKFKILSVVTVVLLLALAGCEAAQQTGERLPKSTRTCIVFNTRDTLYTRGLGEAGVEGFCRRIRNYLAKNLAERGIITESDSDGVRGYAQITITISSIELVAFENMGIFMSYVSNNPCVKCSATLESPSGTTIATWNEEVVEHTVDELSEVVAAEIAKHLSRGFQ